MTKRRISASIDPDLLSAAVKRRGSSNFSAWMAELLFIWFPAKTALWVDQMCRKTP
jgi:hypothetical protein